MSFVKELNLNTATKRTAEEMKKASDLVENARKEDAKLVKGIFKNLEVPGGDLKFSYRRHKGENPRIYHFEDGETYEIPLGVARHINQDTKVPIHSHLIDPNTNKRITAPGSYRQRYQFLSTEYM